MEQQIRFCKTSDGVRIAYATVGSGPPTVIVPAFYSHLEMSWVVPMIRQRYEAMARSMTVVRYDKRGSGLSDRNIDDYSIDARVKDLEAVVDDLGLKQFVLSGGSEGGPVAIAYAARHPNRIVRLILHSTYSSGPALARKRRDLGDAIIALIKAEWDVGARAVYNIVSPGAAESIPAEMAAFQQAIDADAAARMIEAMRTVDVSEDLARISAPTLVIHGRNDKAIPFELGRDIASAIPGAQFFPHDGGHQVFDPVLVKQITDAISKFANPTTSSPPMEPVPNSGIEFVTVLFTDIVGHTEMMLRLGDTAGREVLREHERITREVLSQHAGTEVKTMGDGFMASFTSATRAVDCAVALQRAFAQHNETASEPILVRVGLNAGEPIQDAGDLFGATVILASRVADAGGAGDIMIPEPLWHLLRGKDFAFGDRGLQELKGFPEPVRLFDVQWKNEVSRSAS